MKLSEKNKERLRKAGFVLLSPLLSFVCFSLIKKIKNYEPLKQLDADGKKYVVAFWHGKMLFGWYFFKNKRFAGLTSQSKDGDILASVLEKWGYSVVRGSSSKGGSEALNSVVDEIKSGRCASMTPDGPKGPPHQMKAGAAVAAKKTGVPLILMGISYKRKTRLKSWDRFEIPHPFSFVKVVFSDPVYFDQSLQKEELSAMLPDIEKEFHRVQREADKPFFR
ncbi:MAG: lysophospholipid acyltransferase family protein [Ignavibacteria bacterium]|nr:lysophospholipid acyltransferase family protein [Ignavibacteria bacterium]